jgi:polysaccharide biosynthesis/export protein
MLGRFTAIALLMSQLCVAALAQGQPTLGEKQKSSQAGLTGAGEGSPTTVTKPGRADGLGNPLLGGERRPLYRLHVSDVVDVSFTLSPEFNQTLTVQPDGYVALRDAGLVLAEGRSLEEFRGAVREAYRGYLHDPEVAVALKGFERPHFTVGGQVGHPGKFELRSDTTVAEAVEIAGGFTPQAKHSQVVLFRRVNDNLVETQLIDLKKMLKTHGLREDAHLRPGDFVFVPQNRISKIAQFFTRPSMSMYVSSSQF